MSDAQPLASKVALITGGSRGVGLATARRLVERGAAVALTARHQEALEEAVRSIQAAGGRVLGIAADVTDEAAIQQAVSRTEAELGGLDILINNAGIGRYGPIAEQPADEWRRVVEVNLIGVYLTTRAALPAIRRRGGGQIVSISTGAARQGYPNMSAYCASKWGLQGFMAALTAEVASEPIRCSTVVPGSILTDFGVRTRADRLASGQKFLEPEDVADAILTVLLQPAHAWMQEVTLWPR
ncbi:MAG: SDR family NAD(P)-dependent oxidoreductase [Chloroflexi bacterium]|nr:SDR family NAD(P)-dependent oxidoreductase [Chloroflexota bacterium]